jgi:hypothetical protein
VISLYYKWCTFYISCISRYRYDPHHKRLPTPTYQAPHIRDHASCSAITEKVHPWSRNMVRRHLCAPDSKVHPNIHHTAIPDAIKSTWYAIHEIIPTNECLADKHLADTDRCPECNVPDSLSHRIIECRNEDTIWQWTRSKIAQILRTTPTLQVWPPPRQAAIVWIIAHFVEYKLQWHRHHTLLDYTAYLRRARFKAHWTLPANTTGKYLDIL